MPEKPLIPFAQPLRHVTQAAVRILWPGGCALCGGPDAERFRGLCAECWQDINIQCAEHYCRRCGHTVSVYGIVQGCCGECLGRDYAFDAVARVGVYQGRLRELLLNIKFRDRPEFAPILREMMRACVQANSFFSETDWVVPVPLHWRRRLFRGFNQAMLLGRGLDQEISAKINTDLVRIRPTRRQWGLTVAGRKRNVRGAFRVRKRHPFAGAVVCLVDDITTTRATLNECASVLKKAGAVKVYALVAASTHHDALEVKK